MGQRLGIHKTFQREEVLRHSNNKTNNKRLQVNNYQIRSNTPSFSGFGDSLTKANKWLNDGNYVKGFLVLDVCGFILPRIYQAFMRNREELGGYNYKAATEEAIREFLSGPGIFAVPFSCILLAKNLIGPATNVANDALEALSDKFESMKSDPKTDFKATKENFFSQVLKDSFKTHLSEEVGNGKTSKDIIKLTEKVINIDSKQVEYNEKGFFTKLNQKNPKIKQLKKDINSLKSEITEIVVNLNNKHGKFTNNKANIALANKAELNILTLVDYMSYYANDIVKNVCNDKSANKAELIKNLNLKAKGGKTVLNIASIIFTAAFTYCVPMLYKRNKSYPGTEGLVDKTNPASQPSKQEVAH